MSQNTSHAVMAQRHEPRDSLDDFPTPPWATRAFCEHVVYAPTLKLASVWEPACGDFHMSNVLTEYFERTYATDIKLGQDFLSYESAFKPDWIVTNPPFRLAEQFVLRALEISR